MKLETHKQLTGYNVFISDIHIPCSSYYFSLCFNFVPLVYGEFKFVLSNISYVRTPTSKYRSYLTEEGKVWNKVVKECKKKMLQSQCIDMSMFKFE